MIEDFFFNINFLFSDKAPSEATFRGTEFLSYDLGQTGGEPIVSAQDAISLYFRTRQPNGLLFYTGVYFVLFFFFLHLNKNHLFFVQSILNSNLNKSYNLMKKVKKKKRI